MQLSPKFDAKEIESQVRKYTKPADLQNQILASSRSEKIRFIEGPPTMNGTPHAGHLRGRVIKDLWYRFNTLQGKKIEFNGGWDTQGLPVELQVEKELGVSGGKSEAIRRFGVAKIVAECKRIVEKYNKTWVDVDEKLGISFNHEKAYWTFKDEFIEREWQILKKAHDDGILEEDFTVIAYCPSCQTSLSHSEVNQGYEKVKDPSLYYKVRLKDEDAFLIVWTTMPFTLITDAMVGLHPDEDYVYANVRDETWVVGKTRLNDLMAEAKVEEFNIVKTVKGSEFEGKKYIHPLLDIIPELATHAEAANFHVAVSESFVDAGTGSGLVHLSPANGEEDIKIANKRGVKVFSPINDEAKFTDNAGRYGGLFVRDADKIVVDDLRERDALVRIGSMRHKYPLCWRSRHPIVWLARKGWFYKLDRLDDRAIVAAESVKYFFEQPKNRFLGIIKERHPWCISRERVWGCPMPVWDCEDCGKKNWLFSRKEIVAAATSLPDGPEFEMHRPWIDKIIIKCRKCGSEKTKREEYVLDTWHNSGSAPFSSLSDEEYADEIPAPFFTEGIDQTRGWAYTLLIENVILSGGSTAPYRSFLFQGHVLDGTGGKMSKSKGNVLDGAELLEKYPVDVVRLYFMSKASPIEPLSFDTKEMMSRPYQVISTLFNLHLYFMQNSNYDNYDATKTIQWARQNNMLTAPDVWLLSKLQQLIQKVTEKNESCRFHEGARAIDEYVIGSLSQIYVQITRGELWDEDEEGKDRRTAIYAVMAHVLRTLDVLIHPFCPFISEYLYRTVFDQQNILLDRWPSRDESLVNEQVEESLDIMKGAVSAASAARMKAGLKRRWPLNEARICVRKGQKEKIESLSELLRSQLNVERFSVFETEQESGLGQVTELSHLGLPARGTIELERKRIGPKARQHMGKLVAKFEQTDHAEIIASLQDGSRYDFDVDGNIISLDQEDFIVGFEAGEGFEAAEKDGFTVFISTARNKEMTAKGLVRDVARRLQKLRKERGYNPTDVLGVASVLDLDDESAEMIRERSKELAFLVRVKSINFEQTCSEYKDDDIDGQKIRIAVE